MRVDIPQDKAFQSLGLAVRNWISQVQFLLRGGLTLHENVNQQTVGWTTNVTPDTQDTIDISTLGITWTPSRWDVVRQDKGGVLYESNFGAWSSSTVYFKCSVASMAVVVRFS